MEVVSSVAVVGVSVLLVHSFHLCDKTTKNITSFTYA